VKGVELVQRTDRLIHTTPFLKPVAF